MGCDRVRRDDHYRGIPIARAPGRHAIRDAAGSRYGGRHFVSRRIRVEDCSHVEKAAVGTGASRLYAIRGQGQTYGSPAEADPTPRKP